MQFNRYLRRRFELRSDYSECMDFHDCVAFLGHLLIWTFPLSTTISPLYKPRLVYLSSKFSYGKTLILI
jgi:hypothetical protein